MDDKSILFPWPFRDGLVCLVDRESVILVGRVRTDETSSPPKLFFNENFLVLEDEVLEMRWVRTFLTIRVQTSNDIDRLVHSREKR